MPVQWLEKEVEGDGDKDEQKSQDQGLILRPPEPPLFVNLVAHSNRFFRLGDLLRELVP